jgi:hypothetical protein
MHTLTAFTRRLLARPAAGALRRRPTRARAWARIAVAPVAYLYRHAARTALNPNCS